MAEPEEVPSSTVLIYRDICLKDDDIDLLRGPFWLNDQIIAFYLEYLEHAILKEHCKDILFVSPQVTQLLKASPASEAHVFLEPLRAHEKDFMFFPLNDNPLDKEGGLHWSLLVYSRPENLFCHLDSLNSANWNVAAGLVDILKSALHCPGAHFIKKRARQQGNMSDCGIHVLCNIDDIVTHILQTGQMMNAPMSNYTDIARKRWEILNVVRELTGEAAVPSNLP